MIESIITLLLLILLQAVLGFDNLLYISLESKRAPLEKQSYVRKLGIGIAIVLRIILLVILVKAVEYFQDVFFSYDTSYLHTEVNVHSLIVLGGGIFIMYTAIKEIWHMMSMKSHESAESKEKGSVGKIIAMIVVMNLVFSFDSILSAMALVSEPGSVVFSWLQIGIMATAIIISGILMIVLADRVSEFLQKNRLYEVLGLFVLLLVGIMLITEGGHLAHLEFFGNAIEPMSKTTFYFVLFILVAIDIVQGKYQKRILREKAKLQFTEKK